MVARIPLGEPLLGTAGDFVACPPWLCEHIEEVDPTCRDITDSSHYCETCGPWMRRWQEPDVDFPKGFIKPVSEDLLDSEVWPYNSFTSLCGVWTTPQFFADCCDFYDKDRTGIPSSVIEYSIAYASELLYNLSGRQYPGACERLVYPGCKPSKPIGSQYRNLAFMEDKDFGRCCDVGTCGGGTKSCSSSCADPYILQLPAPIAAVIEIVIDGQVLPPTAYKIRAHRELVRVDGKVWPSSNNFNRSPYVTPDEDDCAAPSWVIRYLHGKCPPIAAQLAAAELARITAKSICSASCLPENVRRISVEGVDIRTLERNSSLFGVRHIFGNYIIDGWLNSVNPAGLQRVGTVYRADRLSRQHRSFRDE